MFPWLSINSGKRRLPTFIENAVTFSLSRHSSYINIVHKYWYQRGLCLLWNSAIAELARYDRNVWWTSSAIYRDCHKNEYYAAGENIWKLNLIEEELDAEYGFGHTLLHSTTLTFQMISICRQLAVLRNLQQFFFSVGLHFVQMTE